jgi:hypothetical protein
MIAFGDGDVWMTKYSGFILLLTALMLAAGFASEKPNPFASQVSADIVEFAAYR